ncbi:MAG: hypothetical protein WDO70_08315 [Alphaproteobacteria bacterium]
MAKDKKTAKPAAKPAVKDAKGKPVKGGGKSKGKGKGFQVLFAIMALLVAIWPTAFLLVPGMLPTLVCLVTDRDKEKVLALTVGATNFAGCLPFILQLWQMGQNLDNSMKLARDVNTWFIMLASAGVGYLIYAVVPGAVASVMAGNAGGKIARLKSNQEELKRLWGSDVANDKKFDEFGQQVAR